MKKAAEFAESLRQLASFYEEHGDFPVPSGSSLNVYVRDKEALAEAARQLGSFDKVFGDDWIDLNRIWTAHADGGWTTDEHLRARQDRQARHS